MVLARFSPQDSLKRVRFFKETFLLIDISIEMVLGMLFLAFSIIDCHFGAEKPIWKFHTIAEALSTINKVEIIDKTKYAKTALDKIPRPL